MSNEKETLINKRLLTITVVLSAIAALAATGLLVNIFEHRQEAKHPFFKTVELSDKIDDPAKWGTNFPMQYGLYLRTKQEAATKFGGDEPERPLIGGLQPCQRQVMGGLLEPGNAIEPRARRPARVHAGLRLVRQY